MSSLRVTVILSLLVCCGILVTGATAVQQSAATLQEAPDYTSVETTYPHPNEDSQAVQVTVSVTHDGESALTDLVVRIRPAARSFIKFDSFSYAQDTSGTVNITRVNSGTVRIEPRLEPGEQVNITFNAYPQTISTEELTVATVRTEYVQNGQQLQEEDTASADLSESYYFQLQDAQDTNAQLRTQIQGMWGFVGVGGLAGLVGLAAAGWFYRTRDSKVTDKEQEFVNKLERLNIRDDQAADKVEDLKDEYETEMVDPGTGGDDDGDDDDIDILE